MASSSRRSVAPVRKLVAAVLGTIAVFVILFGAGMTSWAIVALGVALLVLAISLALVNVVRRGARAWVAGTAHVVSASEPPASSTYGRCELQIVVDAPGLPAAAVKVRDPRVPVAKWPDAGSTLPVMVAVDDMRHVRIQWDEVMTHAEAATVLGDVPPEYGDPEGDVLADDILVGQDLPPWSGRDQQEPSWADAEPATADLSDQLSGLRDEPVVVSTSPGGPIVLEGTLVEPETRPSPLPRRPRPRPRPHAPRAETAAGAAGTAPAGEATGSGPAGGGQPETGGAPTGTAVADPPTISGIDVPLGPPADASSAGRSGAGSFTTGPAAPAGAAASAGPTASAGPHVAAMPVFADDDGTPAGPAPSGADDAAPTDEPITTGPGAGPGSGRTIHGVGITVLVTDLDRSVAFYRDLLGFHEIDGGEGNAVLASGDTRLVLRTVRDAAPELRRSVHLNLEVDDVDRVYAELKSKGVTFTHAPRAVNRGGKLELWSAAFLDPDGHGVAVSEWKPVT